MFLTLNTLSFTNFYNYFYCISTQFYYIITWILCIARCVHNSHDDPDVNLNYVKHTQIVSNNFCVNSKTYSPLLQHCQSCSFPPCPASLWEESCCCSLTCRWLLVVYTTAHFKHISNVQSWLWMPGLCLCVGKVGNLFASHRSTIITLYNGAFDSSSSVFLIVKVNECSRVIRTSITICSDRTL